MDESFGRKILHATCNVLGEAEEKLWELVTGSDWTGGQREKVYQHTIEGNLHAYVTYSIFIESRYSLRSPL